MKPHEEKKFSDFLYCFVSRIFGVEERILLVVWEKFILKCTRIITEPNRFRCTPFCCCCSATSFRYVSYGCGERERKREMRREDMETWNEQSIPFKNIQPTHIKYQVKNIWSSHSYDYWKMVFECIFFKFLLSRPLFLSPPHFLLLPILSFVLHFSLSSSLALALSLYFFLLVYYSFLFHLYMFLIYYNVLGVVLLSIESNFH